MFSACPACKTVYPVRAVQLRAANGRVHCGSCDKVFDVTSALFDTPQQARELVEQQLSDVTREIDDLVGRALDEVPATEPEAPVSEPESEIPEQEQDFSADTPVSDLPDEIPKPLQHDMAEADEQESPDTEIYAQPLGDVTDLLEVAIGAVVVPFPADVDTYAAPVAAEFVSAAPVEQTSEEEAPPAALLFETGPMGAQTSWGAITAALLLTLLLIGQYVWSERYRLAGNAALRPYLETACATLGCDLPLRHETSRLEVLEREIRNHPHVDDALLVSAIFKNGADFAQRYPVFEVAFSNVSGTPVAVRRFQPDEYLNGADPSQGMAPGQQTRVMLEIIDPGGSSAVSFQFNFL